MHGRQQEISAQIEEQVKASTTVPVDLALVGPSSWERVCVLAPYTNNERAEQIIGFKWNAEGKTAITSSDGINVLVFVKDHEVIAYTEHHRNKGDFSKLEPQCLARGQATLVRQPDSGGKIFLITNQQSIISYSSEPPKITLLPIR